MIVAAVAVVYRHAPGAYFFEDDFPWFVSMWTYRPASILQPGSHSHFYRPVIELYFWLAIPLFDGSPRLFHLANVVLHAVNGLLLCLLVRALSGRDRCALVAALFFVVLPGYVHAITWVSALAEPVGALFACLTLLWFLRYRRTAERRWLVLSVSAFALALLTHESSVVILPLVLLVEWAAGDSETPSRGTWTRPWIDTLRACLPYVALTIIYLAVDVPINRRNYVVEEGHYRIGWHAVRNVLGYVVSLYVGKRGWLSYGLVSAALAGLVLKGTRLAKFGTVWMLVALLPFAFFTWGNTSRYLYLPAMGFALLLAEGVEWIDRTLARRLAARPRAALVALVVAIVTVRFMVFASKGVDDFLEMTARYRAYRDGFRQQHPQLAPHSRVPLDPEAHKQLGHRYLQPLVQWEYRDQTITLVPPER